MSSPLLHWLCLGFLTCLVDAPVGRPQVSMGVYDVLDRAVELWKGSQRISLFNGSLQIDPQYKDILQFDAGTRVYSISCPRVEDSGRYTFKKTSEYFEYIVYIFGPSMENQSIPLVPFNESTMRAKLFASTDGGPFIRVASYHNGSKPLDQTVALQVKAGFLQLENHTAADRRLYRLEINEARDYELHLIANSTLIIAPACKTIPTDNRTFNESTERNTTKSDNEEQTKTRSWKGIVNTLKSALLFPFRLGFILALVVFGIPRVCRVQDVMAKVKDWMLGKLTAFNNWWNTHEPVDDSDGDLNGNAEEQNTLNPYTGNGH